MAQTLDQYGNVVTNGYSTNMTPEQTSAISLSSLTPQKPLNLPQVPADTTDYSQYITPTITSLASDYANVNKNYNSVQEGQKSNAQSQLDIMGLLTGKTSDLQAAEDAAGVGSASADLTNYASQLANLNAQASSLNREATAIPIQVQGESVGRGRTESGVAPITTGRLRENALRALSIGQQADVAAAAATGSQLRLNAAKEKAKQLVDLKYKPLEDQLAIKKQQYELNKDILSSIDKKRTESLNAAIKREETALAEKKANEKAVSDLIVNASSQGAPTDVVSRASKAKNASEAAAILGQYAGDYWGTKLKIAQYNKVLSETNKIDTQTSGLKLQPTGVVTTPNGDAVSLPNETLGAIGRLKLNEGQSNAVAFVSRMIQANAAIKKQLGTISPTGGFYETSGYDPTSFGSGIGRAVSSDNSRIYNTNAQDFIRAKLRKESGATISPEEFTADAAIYAPSGMGLDQKDLLLAETKREEAIKSMIAQSGPAAPYLQQYYEQVKANNGVPYDPYLDGQAIPSVSKNSGTAMSSDAYGNSLVNQTQP